VARAELPTRATCIPVSCGFLSTAVFVRTSIQLCWFHPSRSFSQKQQPKSDRYFSKSCNRPRIFVSSSFLFRSGRDSTPCVSCADPLRSSRIFGSGFFVFNHFSSFFSRSWSSLNGRTRYLFPILVRKPVAEYFVSNFVVCLILLSCFILALKAFHLSRFGIVECYF
jgi:hypothetical protein